MKGSTWAKLAGFAACVAGVGWVLRALGLDATQVNPQRIQAFVLSFGVWAPLIYVLAYGQPLVPLPASMMTPIGGLAFGPAWGTLAALAGATLRACSQFLVARLLGRDTVSRLLKGTVAQLDHRLGANAFQAVLLIRLIPNFPFDVQNYGLGFSRVRFGPYAAATILGIVPGSVAYVYLGYSLTDPKQIWKLGLAVVSIVALMWSQRAWSARRRQGAPPGRNHE